MPPGKPTRPATTKIIIVRTYAQQAHVVEPETTRKAGQGGGRRGWAEGGEGVVSLYV